MKGQNRYIPYPPPPASTPTLTSLFNSYFYFHKSSSTGISSMFHFSNPLCLQLLAIHHWFFVSFHLPSLPRVIGQWLASLDQRVLETVELAVCLNSIASGEESKLYAHSSKSRKDPSILPLYEVHFYPC